MSKSTSLFDQVRNSLTPRGSANSTRGSTPRPSESKVPPRGPISTESAEQIVKEVTAWVKPRPGEEPAERALRKELRDLIKDALKDENTHEMTVPEKFRETVRDLTGFVASPEMSRVDFRIYVEPRASLPLPEPLVRKPSGDSSPMSIDGRIAALAKFDDPQVIEGRCRAILQDAEQVADLNKRLEFFWQLATRMNEASSRLPPMDGERRLAFAGKIFATQLQAKADSLREQMKAESGLGAQFDETPTGRKFNRLFSAMQHPMNEYKTVLPNIDPGPASG